MIYDLQKANMWKRISAFLFDGILLGILAVLFAWLLSMVLRYDSWNNKLNDAYTRYGEEYGVRLANRQDGRSGAEVSAVLPLDRRSGTAQEEA